MTYDFDKVTVRRGTSCVKWDVIPSYATEADMADVIPMWVADMDFEVAPFICDAVRERALHPVYGYNIVPKEYYLSVCSWFSRYHGWEIDPSWIVYTTGVVPAMSAVIRALAPAGKKVAIFTPAYNCFFRTIRNNGCEVAECPLVCSGGRYTIDFEAFDRLCADPECVMLLFCNPHNPGGRVWTREELLRVSEICRRHDVLLVSDEIHCEIVMPGHRFIPFASLSGEIQHECVTMNSSSKAFNTAGLQIANIISDNPEWRGRIAEALDHMEITGVNPFGQVALRAAYTDEGAEWLRQLNGYIKGNYDLLLDVFAKRLPDFPVLTLEGTYLAWFDTSALGGMPTVEIEKSLILNEKVWVNNGTMYGRDGFMRINLAAPRSLISEGLDRLASGLRRLCDART